MERPWQEELQKLLDVKLRAFSSSLGQAANQTALRIAPPLGPDEAKHFLRGIEAGVFALDEQGRVQSSLIRAGKDEGGGHGHFSVFAANPEPPRLCRRLVSVLATASALIVERGWLHHQVELAAIKEPDSATTNPADIIITSLDDRLLAAVVAKRTAYELSKFRTDLSQCARRGPHSVDNCGFPQNHGTFEFLAANQPPYLWVVAPDGEFCLQLTFQENGTINMMEFHSLPPRSLFELQSSKNYEPREM